MYSSKLVDVFYSLSKTQLRALRKFVISPYHNKREDVIALFELMYKTPLENRVVLRKEKAFPKIFGKGKYSADKIDYTMSFLFKVIEQFLAHQNSIKDKVGTQIALMEEYQKLGLPKHFQQSLSQAKNIQGKQALRDISYHEKDFNIELIEYEFLALQKREASKNLSDLNKKLDLLFLSQKLKNGCLLLAHQSVAKQQYNFGLLESIIPYIQANSEELLQHPAISVYYYYYQAMIDQTNDEQFFQQFKATFLQSITNFERREIQDLYLFAVNYCIKKSNLGQTEYQSELFDFYVAGLKFKILINDNSLSQFTFKNITRLALRLGKIDWTEQFIEDYKVYVDIRYHDTYIHYAYSALYFAQGKYEETMSRLLQVDYNDLFITMDAKVLQIRVYYHLDEYDALESFINSFKVFLRRKDILAYHRDIYKNFIRMTQKLMNLPPFNKTAKAKLRKEIEDTQMLLEKKWLLEMLD